MIEFGEWLPDQSDLGNSGVLEAKNVLPAVRGYKPMNGLSEISNASTAYLNNMFATRDATSTVKLFAGDATKLYLYGAADSDLDVVSKSGNYTMSTSDKWRFSQFGDYVLASSGHDNILQKFQIGTSSLFADVTGSPAAKYMAVVKDFVICANVKYSSTVHQSRLYWSSINNSQAWTIGTNQSDIQDIPDAGAITGLVGGENGVVMMERGIARLEYVGSPLVFTVQRIETTHGCEIPNSIVSLGTYAIFYISSDGFFMFNGNQSVPIGSEKVDNFFFDNVNPAFKDRISAAIDPQNQVVMWSFVSNDSSGEPDKILCYNYVLSKWSLIEIAHESLGVILLPGYSLEQLDNISTNLDTLTTSFDSTLYAGDTFTLAASKDKKIHSFTGAILDATIVSKEFEVSPSKSSVINSVTPYVTAKNPTIEPTLSVSVGSRNKQIDVANFTNATALNSDNFCNVRSHGRYHRVKIDISGDYRYALGIDVDAKQLGRR